jgi:hypothetical protein
MTNGTSGASGGGVRYDVFDQMLAKAREFADLLGGGPARRQDRLRRDYERVTRAMALRYFCTDETPEATPEERAIIAAYAATQEPSREQ